MYSIDEGDGETRSAVPSARSIGAAGRLPAAVPSLRINPAPDLKTKRSEIQFHQMLIKPALALGDKAGMAYQYRY